MEGYLGEYPLPSLLSQRGVPLSERGKTTIEGFAVRFYPGWAQINGVENFRVELTERPLTTRLRQAMFAREWVQVRVHDGLMASLCVRPAPTAKEFYVCDTRGRGSFPTWWGKDCDGYTYRLAEAGLYSAHDVCGMRATDVPVHKSVVERHAVQVVSGLALFVPEPKGQVR